MMLLLKPSFLKLNHIKIKHCSKISRFKISDNLATVP